MQTMGTSHPDQSSVNPDVTLNPGIQSTVPDPTGAGLSSRPLGRGSLNCYQFKSDKGLRVDQTDSRSSNFPRPRKDTSVHMPRSLQFGQAPVEADLCDVGRRRSQRRLYLHTLSSCDVDAKECSLPGEATRVHKREEVCGVKR